MGKVKAIWETVKTIGKTVYIVWKTWKTVRENVKQWFRKLIKTKLKDDIKESILDISIYGLLLGISINSTLYSIKLISAILILMFYTWLLYKLFFRKIPALKKFYKKYKSKKLKTFLTALQLSIREIVIEKSIISLIGIILILGITRLVLGKYKVLDPIFNLF